MAARILPTPEQLRELLHYEPETGKLFWRPRPREMFATKRAFGLWNTRFSGHEAFTSTNNNGYRHGKVFGVGLLAHRVIWAIQMGSWPSDCLDHIDTNRENNLWGNLREASRTQNMHNQASRATNSSGYKGVHWDKRVSRYRAQISVNGRKKFLGNHDSAEAAYAAYCLAARSFHGEFARTE